MEASFMSDATSQTIYFYNRHPISCEIILAKLRASRGHLDGLRPEQLFPHDQDHYGGLAAPDELTPARVSGAQELTRRVGLHGTARVVEGNVMEVPLTDESIDAVVSQEAFCHVPDVKKAVAEAFRILRTDGRLAFTDWIANQPLTAADAQLMWEGMAIQPLRSIPEYRSLVESVGFTVISTKDLTEEWGPILKERLAMYQALREEARQAGTPMGHDAFHKSYIRFVDLMQERKLGGVRMVATKSQAR